MQNSAESMWPCFSSSNGWYPCSLAILRGSKSGEGNESQSYQPQPKDKNQANK